MLIKTPNKAAARNLALAMVEAGFPATVQVRKELEAEFVYVSLAAGSFDMHRVGFESVLVPAKRAQAPAPS